MRALKIDMTRNPYRGIYAEVAQELSRSGRVMTKQAVRQSYMNGNARIVQMVDRKIKQREAMMGEGWQGDS